MFGGKTSSSRLPVCYLDDDILLTASHAWTYVRIPLVPYEFLTKETREDLCNRMTMGLSQLITSNQETVEVHLKVTHKPFATRLWKKALNSRVSQSGPAPVWGDYLDRMADRVEYANFSVKEVHLGVCLGPRKGKGSPNGKGKGGKGLLGDMLSPFSLLTSKLESATGMPDDVVPEWELGEWRAKAKSIHRTLRQGSLRAVPANSSEVAWLIAKPFWPNMRQPSPTSSGQREWGPGSLQQLVEGVATNYHRYVEMTQMNDRGMEQTGYAATLAVSRFPDVLYFPDQEPWIHFAESLLIQADFSSRFSIVPSLKVAKDVGKKLADAKDQAQHIAETGASIPLKVKEQLQVATALEYQIDKDRMPWAYARHRITVTGPTPEDVASKVKTMLEKYRELGMDLVLPTGDQLELLMESMPGGKIRSTAYYQRQELSVISGGMPMASSDCGDRVEDKGGQSSGQSGWLGPYLAYTNARVLQPVLFSPHNAIARNNPPGVAITGSPGGGKALDLDTLIPTPEGFIRMGDLQVGDTVYDENGEPTLVVEAHSVLHDRPCFEMLFVDAETGVETGCIVADGEHLWPVREKDGRERVASTEEIFSDMKIRDKRTLTYRGTAVTPDGSPVEHVLQRVTPVDSRPVRCIKVANESHLFLAGEGYIPTHNTFLAFTLAYQMAASGVWTIYIDPKADAKPMASLPGLGNPRVFDLRDGNDGILDPFGIGASKSESTLLALETLRLLLGGNVSEDKEEALLNAVEIVANGPTPSLNGVVDYLLANTELASARNLGAMLRTIRDLPFARLCFSPLGAERLRPEDGLTVVTLLGLDLPAAATLPDDYSYENRLAVAVMYLLTRYSRQLMLNMDKNHPKAICIDEAWAITSTSQGAKLIPEIARMGRSHNTALILVSQNAADLMAESVTNSLSTKFAFRSSIPAEVNAVMELFGLPQDQNFQSYVRNLRNGQCLMQDVDGRVATVKIDSWDTELMEAFDTNPETRGKKVLGDDS